MSAMNNPWALPSDNSQPHFPLCYLTVSMESGLIVFSQELNFSFSCGFSTVMNSILVASLVFCTKIANILVLVLVYDIILQMF